MTGLPCGDKYRDFFAKNSLYPLQTDAEIEAEEFLRIE